ncbi:MAG: hypothetical protein WCO56_23665 [Verrucomicrobiota bacterium]
MKPIQYLLSSFTLCLALIMSQPITSHAKATHITKVSRIATPPAGKALVNIHRTYHGVFRCAIFDEKGTFLMDLPEYCEWQQVCEPGQKSFLVLFAGGVVQVITADLAADKTYDFVIDDFSGKDIKVHTGYRGFLFTPLSMNPRWRTRLDELEKQDADKVFTLERDAVAIEVETSKRDRVNDVIKDYLGGTKSESVIHTIKEDGR